MNNRILVVEGQDQARQGLVAILSQAGYEVMACMDVVTAAGAIGRRNDSDLLVVNTAVKSADDGIKFIRFIYRHCNGLIPPVLVISAEASETLGAIPGVVDFLACPCDPKDLLARVHRILDQREKIMPLDLQAQLKKLLNGSPDLPTLSEFKLEVVRCTTIVHSRDPFREAAVKEVADLVSRDPSFSGHLIARANRVLKRGKGGEVKTALEAVGRLGLQQVHSIAVATSVLDMTRTCGHAPGFNPKNLWVHSVAADAITRVLGDHLRLEAASIEVNATAAILHDIGKIVICNFFPDFLDKVLGLMRAESCTMAEAEQRIGGFTHATVGAQLAQRWPLPQTLAVVIASHHTAGSRGLGETARMTSIIQVADAVSYQIGMGFGLARVVPPINPEALKSLGLKVEDIERLKPTMLAAAKDMITDLPFQA